MRIAFIGLGNMGGPMALNLIKGRPQPHRQQMIPQRDLQGRLRFHEAAGVKARATK
jgi:3-hydroxyisobutyrate dehydrogenase-like beta-hydroxyacid dehydrogenase